MRHTPRVDPFVTLTVFEESRGESEGSVFSYRLQRSTRIRVHKGGVFSEPAFFFNELAQLTPYELTYVRPSPGDCAAGWAQAARKV